MALSFSQWSVFLLLSFLAPANHPSSGAANKAPHPFYVSVTEISHNPAEKSLEISCKFFAEDLEQILEKDYKTHLDISKPVGLKYVGYEKDKESAYAYFEVGNVASVKSIGAVNSLLHDFIDQQINIMHVTVGGKRQSTKLDYPDTKASFSF